jgi:hypothetical protein
MRVLPTEPEEALKSLCQVRGWRQAKDAYDNDSPVYYLTRVAFNVQDERICDGWRRADDDNDLPAIG